MWTCIFRELPIWREKSNLRTTDPLWPLMRASKLRADSSSHLMIAEEGLEVVMDFSGKTYILGFAGDSLGIIPTKSAPEQG